MKKLFPLPLFFFTVIASSQPLQGINEEDLIVSPSLTSNVRTGLKAKKISLKTGVTLDYVEKGTTDGTPVIFLHGLSDSWHSFEASFEHLPASVHGFAITQRGHGDSEKPLEGYTPKEFAADIAAFVQQKALGPVIIAGHSMGGVNALQFVLSYPKLVKALVIIDSDASFIDNPGMPEFYSAASKIEGNISFEFMDEFQKSTLAHPIDSNWYQLLVAEGMKTPVHVFQSALKGILQVDFVPQLNQIDCPVLIFWGDKDSICAQKGQDLMASKIRKVKRITYAGVGHALHWEEPKRFANDLVQFIQSLYFVYK